MTNRKKLSLRLALASGLALIASTSACSRGGDRDTAPPVAEPATAPPPAPTADQITPTHNTETYGTDNAAGTEDRTYTNTYDRSRSTPPPPSTAPSSSTTGTTGTGVIDDTSDGSASGGSEQDTTPNRTKSPDPEEDDTSGTNNKQPKAGTSQEP